MITLGINAAFHDCSATLIVDGSVVAAAEEERFTQVKHGKRPLPFTTWQLPYHAIDYCLRSGGVSLGEVDRVGYSFDPYLLEWAAVAPEITRHGASPAPALRFELPDTITLPLQPSARPLANPDRSPWDPLFLSYVVNAPRQLAGGAPHHLCERFAGVTFENLLPRWRYIDHHLAHEASAFLASPYEDCAVLTMDGRGEAATASAGVFRNGEYRRLRQVNLPHSLGLLYEDVTRWLGFLHSSDEYKVMALASYGRPRQLATFRELIHVDRDGGYTVRRPDLSALFGPPRRRGAPFTALHYDVAASLQQAIEEAVLEIARWLHRSSGMSQLAMAGGVALNCVMNARLRDEGPFESVWVQPAAGDAGTALGAALWTDWHERAAHERRRWVMHHAYLGPEYGEDAIESLLRWARLPYRRCADLPRETAQLLAQDRIVGWFQGRMEFGPRALGARSILASPRSASMQQRLNDLKDREDFRPVAPVVPEEHAANWFVARRRAPSGRAPASGFPAPFMIFVFDVREDVADRIPAVRHVDGTARVQTVRRDDNPAYHDLLIAFGELTGVPVLVNTSFNTRGKPIVCSPRDALETFWTSPLDALAIGPFLVEKPCAATT